MGSPIVSVFTDGDPRENEGEDPDPKEGTKAGHELGGTHKTSTRIHCLGTLVLPKISLAEGTWRAAEASLWSTVVALSCDEAVT